MTSASDTIRFKGPIFLAGHQGMVGRAIARQLRSHTADVLTQTRSELDLTDQQAVRTFMDTHKPGTVIIAAARVGGIHANQTYPADFLFDNLMIEANLIRSAYQTGVERLLFLGSSCIYPREAQQPIREEALMTGPLELTNEPYAIAKIAGIKLCESYNRQYGTDFRSVMPSNLYGPGDNFHPENSHVVPVLIRRFHEAAQSRSDTVTVWGTGQPRREFLHVDDMAAASLFVLGLDRETYAAHTEPTQSHINVGTGEDIAISELAKMIADMTGFKGKIIFDRTRPDGTMRKVMNVERLGQMGWSAQIGLRDGLQQTYDWYLDQLDREQSALRL